MGLGSRDTTPLNGSNGPGSGKRNGNWDDIGI